MSGRKLRIGLLGCGNVGSGLVELLTKRRALIQQRAGVELSIANILVRDADRRRAGIDRTLFTTDADKVISNGCDLIVELMGGIEPARSMILQALDGGKHVVTANKALLAKDGFGLLAAADSRNLRLGFEASVCGGIPIIRALRNGFVGDQIERITGILNGTCNYILTRMDEDRMDFLTALAEAQAKGFAEADPTLDIDGHDAAQKLKILAELAFNGSICSDAMQLKGIRDITADDIRGAREMGYVIKHIATAELLNNDGAVTLSAQPMLIASTHALAAVRNENNAVLVSGHAVGEMFFSGRGAGSLPSASAVLADIVDIACHQGGFSVSPNDQLRLSSSEKDSRHYLRFPVTEASAIGPITSALERSGIQVARAAALWGKGQPARPQVRVLTHACAPSAIARSLQAITALGLQTGKSVAFKVAD